jgi:hypothetical protein
LIDGSSACVLSHASRSNLARKALVSRRAQRAAANAVPAKHGTHVASILRSNEMPTTRYPQCARNYMDKEPKLPTPQICNASPMPILKAATERLRDVKVGMMSKINTTMAKIAPPSARRSPRAGRAGGSTTSRRHAIPEGALWRASGRRHLRTSGHRRNAPGSLTNTSRRNQ